jgi:hypothetical protein
MFECSTEEVSEVRVGFTEALPEFCAYQSTEHQQNSPATSYCELSQQTEYFIAI